MISKITPRLITGKISSISSKSHIHRCLICSAFCKEQTQIIFNGNLSDDILATINCLKSLGAKINFDKNSILVEPITYTNNNPILDCNESGSTLRFLLPVASALNCNATYKGCGKLPTRPIKTIIDELKLHGINFSSDHLPLTTSGKIKGDVFTLDGSVSSQFLTGVLLSLPILDGGKVALTTPLTSKSYIDLTCQTLKQFGIEVDISKNEYVVESCYKYKSPKTIYADGDWSNSAFFLCCGAISESINITGLNLQSPQGDKKIIDILRQYGADISFKNDSINVFRKDKNALNVDATDIPDLVPIISVLASVANGESVIANVDRLKFKESDRIRSTLDMINSLGGNARFEDNKIKIIGKESLDGGNVCGYNDHRIVMSSAISSCVCKKEVTITDANAVNKSYPKFFEDFNFLGGNAHVI